MKLLYTLLISAIAALIAWAAFSPADAMVIDEIIVAFEQGNAEGLVSHFSDEIKSVSITERELGSKQEIKQTLADFFREFPPIDFEEKHRGKSRGDQSVFLIGELKTEKGNFRVNLGMALDKITVFEIQGIKDSM